MNRWRIKIRSIAVKVDLNRLESIKLVLIALELRQRSIWSESTGKEADLHTVALPLSALSSFPLLLLLASIHNQV